MNKADIVNSLRLKRMTNKEDKEQHLQMVEDVLGIIRDFLQAGQNVTIANFGAFKCQRMQARNARNPKTGKQVFLEPHIKISFKPAPLLKKGIKL